MIKGKGMLNQPVCYRAPLQKLILRSYINNPAAAHQS